MTTRSRHVPVPLADMVHDAQQRVTQAAAETDPEARKERGVEAHAKLTAAFDQARSEGRLDEVRAALHQSAKTLLQAIFEPAP